MLVSMFAPPVGAAAAAGSASSDAVDGEVPDIAADVDIDVNETSVVAETDDSSPDTAGYDAADAGDPVDDSLAGATGETVVLVSVERQIDSVAAMDAERAIEELRDDAAETQAPVENALETEFGAEVHNTYWAGNIITATVDLDEYDAESLLRIDGVEAVSDNTEYERPDPPTTAEASPSELDGDFTFGLEQINVPEFDEEFDGMGDGATIMVGDDGISNPAEGHPDLEFALEAIVENGEVDEGTLVGGEEGSHGEHVSGTATGAEEPAGDVPRYGVAPNADLLKADVFAGGAFTEDIIASMEWAAENDADVASFSLGFPPSADDSTFSDLYVPVIEDVNAAGTSAVVSAGNSGSGDAGGPVTSPATNFDSVAIGASNEAGDIATFSSGAVVDDDSVEFIDGDELPERFPDEFVQPDVSAPGEDVLSSGPLGPPIDDDEATYSFASGTSMAAPHYAGAVALVQSATDEDLDNSVIEAALAETAEKDDNDFTELNNRDIRFGTGIIDVHAAAEAAQETQTIEGTVTNAAGEPLVGATVETDEGALTAADEDGEFILQTTNDPATVTADAVGVGAETVTVEDGEDVDFALEEELDVTLIEDQPATLEAGDEFDIVAEVQNLDQVTLELTDDSTTDPDDLTVSIGDDELAFGEPVETDGLSGEVAITVEVAEDAVDTEFSIEHTFERFGEDPGEGVFEVTDLDAPATAAPGDEIDVSATILNTGDDADSQVVEFVFDNETVADKELSLDADESATITFDDIPLPDAEGDFEHGVFTDDDSQTAMITIEDVDAEASVTFAEEDVVFAPDSPQSIPVQTDADNIAGYQVTIEFDPDMIQVDSVTTGDVGNGPTTDIDNDEGTVGIVDSSADGVDQPDLANVTFEFVGEGGEETDLTIADDGTTVTTADAEDLDTVGQDVTWASGQLGDVNANGQITPADAVLTQQFIIGEEPADTFIEELADVTQSGDVTVSDALAIEELVLSTNAGDSLGSADAQPGDDGEEVVVTTGPTEVLDEIEGPDFELSNLEQADTLEIDEDIIGTVDLTNEGDETGSIEILYGTDLDDSLVFIPADIEEIELAPGETETVERNLGSFEDINDALDSGFEPGDDILTGFQIGDDLNPNEFPDPVIEQELAENISIAGSDFAVSDLEAPGEADPGDSIDVNATVTNLGTDADTQDIEFVFDGDVVESTEVSLDSDESADVEFTDIELPEEDGAFEHGVFTEDDDQTATITVGDVDLIAVVDETTFGEEDRPLSDEEQERLERTDAPVTEVGDDLIERLESQTTAEVVSVTSEEAVDAAGDGVYDAFVLNEMDPDEIEAFDDSVEEGVVWLDHWGGSSNAIADKSDVLDNPDSTSESFTDPNPDLEITEDHPLFEDIGEEGDSFLIHDADFADHTWFDGYEGGDVVGQIQAGGVTDGDGVAVNDEDNYVLLSSFGSSTFVDINDFSDEADALLGNAVDYVLNGEDDVDEGLLVDDVDPAGDFDVEPGAELEIDATVVNTANDTLTQDVEFVFAGETAASEEVEVDPDDSETVTFEVTAPDDEGEFDWFVATEDDESATWTLTVEEEPAEATSVAVVGADLETEDIDALIEELRESDLSEEEINARLENIESDDVGDLSETIDDGLDDDAYDVVDLSADDLLENTDHDVYVISDFAEESDVVEFQDAIDDDTGVLYLDNWNSFVGANGVVSLVEETGDPAETDNAFLGGDVLLELTEDHPLFDGVGDAGEVITHMSADDADRRWFNDYSGDVLAEVSAEGEEDLGGPAIGVSDEDNEVLLSSHARENGAPDDAFTEESNQILFNAIEYVDSADDVDDGGVEIVDLDPAADLAVEPGAELEINATVENTADDMLAQDVAFVFDGEVLLSEEVELDPAETETVTFEVTAPEDEGEFEWFVETDDDESQAYVLTVEGAGEEEFAVDSLVVTPEEPDVETPLLLDASVLNVGDAEGTADSIVEIDLPGAPSSIVLSPPDSDEFTTEPLAPDESELLLLDLGTLEDIAELTGIDLEPGDEVDITHVVGQDVNPIEDPEPDVDDTETVTVVVSEDGDDAAAEEGLETEADVMTESENASSVAPLAVAP